MSNDNLKQGVWVDPVTDLMWSCISIGQVWSDGECLGNAQKLNWNEANTALKNFNLTEFNDWRIPSIEELETIEKYKLQIEEKIIDNTKNNSLSPPKNNEMGKYWSSSSYNNDNMIYGINFDNLFIGAYFKTNLLYVRPVRGQVKIVLEKKSIINKQNIEERNDIKNETSPNKGTFLGGVFFGIMLGLFSAMGGFVAGPFPALISLAVVLFLLFASGKQHFFGALLGFIIGTPIIVIIILSLFMRHG